MTWQDVLDHPSLQDLPFKIELNEWGQIVMSPASNKHGYYQVELAVRLQQALSAGRVITESSIDTAKGVKVADVVWASEAFIEKYGFETPYPKAPEICAEIRSPSNTTAEMEEKIMLYLAKGAREVWICDLEGRLSFHGNEGALEKSYLAPDFPSQI
jgi:Uma2 family endonuclease